MYRHLRTNLPREVMGFAELPFTPGTLGSASIDQRRYCGHEEVRPLHWHSQLAIYCMLYKAAAVH